MSEPTAIIRAVLDEHGRLPSPIDAVADADSLFDAGLSSLAAVNVMLALEAHFDIEFPDRFLKRATFESVANLRAAVEEMLVS